METLCSEAESATRRAEAVEDRDTRELTWVDRSAAAHRMLCVLACVVAGADRKPDPDAELDCWEKDRIERFLLDSLWMAAEESEISVSDFAQAAGMLHVLTHVQFNGDARDYRYAASVLEFADAAEDTIGNRFGCTVGRYLFEVGRLTDTFAYALVQAAHDVSPRTLEIMMRYGEGAGNYEPLLACTAHRFAPRKAVAA